VIGGSVAHGLATPLSDLDAMFVLTEETAAAHAAEGRLTIHDDTLVDYEGVYLDAKVTSISFIEEVAERGSEPARWAFEDAFAAYSRLDGLERLIAAAATYPE
jgi:hypothetical protein